MDFEPQGVQYEALLLLLGGFENLCDWARVELYAPSPKRIDI